MATRTIASALLTLLLAAFAGTANKAFADPFTPRGKWISPGFDFSLTFTPEEGKVLFREEGRSSERQVVIVKRSERFLRLAPPSVEGNMDLMGRSFDLIRLNDNAMAFAGGCVGGFLLVREEAGLALSDKPPAKGLFGAPDEDGKFVWMIDLARGVGLINGKEEPLNMRQSPLKGAVRLDFDHTTFDARLVGDAILALYVWDEHAQKSMPPFGLVAVPCCQKTCRRPL